jgi:hypothetical protein
MNWEPPSVREISLMIFTWLFARVGTSYDDQRKHKALKEENIDHTLPALVEGFKGLNKSFDAVGITLTTILSRIDQLARSDEGLREEISRARDLMERRIERLEDRVDRIDIRRNQDHPNHDHSN